MEYGKAEKNQQEGRCEFIHIDDYIKHKWCAYSTESLSERIKSQDPTLCCLQVTQLQILKMLRVKGWKR